MATTAKDGPNANFVSITLISSSWLYHYTQNTCSGPGPSLALVIIPGMESTPF